MSKKLIDLHKEWMETGKISGAGLCFSLPEGYKEYLKMLTPTQVQLQCDDSIHFNYWAGNINDYFFDLLHRYTPLRQTIVLLICAMCDEL